MLALSLYQPWASLIALGKKKIETRSWMPPASATGKRIYIHAGKTFEHWLCHEEPFYSALAELPGFHVKMDRDRDGIEGERLSYSKMPRGCLVATAVIYAVLPTSQVFGIEEMATFTVSGCPLHCGTYHQFDIRHSLSEEEKAFGDYSPGRFAWLLEDVEALPEPIPYRGEQRLFEVNL